MTFAGVWPIKRIDGDDSKSSPYFRTLVLSQKVHFVSVARISRVGRRARPDRLVGLAISPVGEHADERCFRRPRGFLRAAGLRSRYRTLRLRTLPNGFRHRRLARQNLPVEPEEVAHLVDGRLQDL